VVRECAISAPQPPHPQRKLAFVFGKSHILPESQVEGTLLGVFGHLTHELTDQSKTLWG
jgi:hypothetical protein